MAIEPIKGFYVHDEVTDTDGVASFDANSLIGDVSFETLPNTFVGYANGNEGTVSSYSCTDFIRVYDGLIVYVRTWVGNDLAAICFYNDSKAFISGYNPYSDNGNLVAIDVPDDAEYIRVSCLTANVGKLSVLFGEPFQFTFQKAISSVPQSYFESYMTEKVRGDVSVSYELQQGSYIAHTDGKVVTLGNNSFYSSNLLDVQGAEKIVVVSSFVDSAGAAFYDADGSFISGVEPADGYNGCFFSYEIDVPMDAVYFRFSVYLRSGSSLNDVSVKRIVTISNLYDFALQWETKQREISRVRWAYSLWKVLCIGDSLTSGSNYTEEWGEMSTPGASIDQNYPRLLGRMIDGEVTNAGFGGYSASTWYTNKNAEYDFENYDTFIIWLGTNNGLTDTLDVDVNAFDDYNDFAETETGYYCKIIESIKAQNPSCLIVLTTVFGSKGNVATTNSVINQIAQKYNLLVVDNSDLSASNHPELHGGVNNPHFGKAGNIFVANRYVEKLNSWFSENPLRCEYGYTPRTN